MKNLRHFSTLTLLPILISLFSSEIYGADKAPIKIIGPTQVDVYKLVELQAEGDLKGAAVIWDITPDDVADSREYPGGKFIFTGPPGSYKIKCRVIKVDGSSINIDSSKIVVVIGVNPNPPIPPIPPNPPVPVPTDPLTKSIQDAWVLEADPQKAAQLYKLNAVYGSIAFGLNADTTGTRFKTVNDLFLAFKAEEDTRGLTPTTLPKVRRVIADYLNSQIGTTSTAPLDRTKALNAFNNVVAATSTLK